MQHGSKPQGERREPMQAIAELALTRVDAASFDATLQRVAELAKQSLTGAREVSVTVVEGGRPRSTVFTGRLAADLDELQYESALGPCLDAAATGATIIVHEGEARYRDFALAASRAGIRQTVSVGMPIGLGRTGALNIYSADDSVLREGRLEDAQIFAAYAAVVINNLSSLVDAASEAMNLRIAMESRSVIEQAKGIVMASTHCTGEEAFDVLRRISQEQNVKLRELAQALVDSLSE